MFLRFIDTAGHFHAVHPDCIESINQHPELENHMRVRTMSGQEILVHERASTSTLMIENGKWKGQDGQGI